MKTEFIKISSWVDAPRITDMLQAQGITPRVFVEGYTCVKIIIDKKDLKTAQTICDGWRRRK